MNNQELKHAFKFNTEDTTIVIENVQHRLIKENIHPHSHGELCYEIHYIQSGEGSLKLDNKHYILSPGALFIAGPYIEHSYKPKSTLEEYYVYFNIKKLPKQNNNESNEWLKILSLLSSTPAWFGTDRYNISISMNELLNTALKKEFGYQTEFKSLFLQFLLKLIRNILPNDYVNRNTNNENSYVSLHRTIERALAKFDMSLSELSSELYLSQRQTERLIKKLYGKSFSKKKMETRMLAASDLLLSTDKSISEVSDILCYSSIGHFSSQFSAYFGVTPSQYKKINKD